MKSFVTSVSHVPMSKYERAQNDLVKALIFLFALCIGFIPEKSDFMSLQIYFGYILALIPFLLCFMALRSPLLEKDATPISIALCCILPGVLAFFAMPFVWAITLAVATVIVCSPIYVVIGNNEQTIKAMIEPLMHYWNIPFGDGLFILLHWGFALLCLRLAKLLPKEFGAGRWRSVFMIYGTGFIVAASLGLGRFLQPYIGYSPKIAGMFSIFIACMATLLLLRELSKPWFPKEDESVATAE